MSSYTAKPYSASGRPASNPRFNAQKDNGKGNSQTLPAAIPSFSGDILKQQIAAMQSKKSQSLPKTGQAIKQAAPTTGPLINEKELKFRRESMHKTPAPRIPDAKPTSGETPEFLRKKLKPTKSAITETDKKNDKADKTEETELNKEDQKKCFRNSKLLFESISAAPKVASKPTPKPKPRSMSGKLQETLEDKQESQDVVLVEQDLQNSATDSNTESQNLTSAEQNKSQIAMPQESVQASDQFDKVLNSDDGKNIESEKELLGKPQNFQLPIAPIGLDLWMKNFARSNADLKRLDNSDIPNTPPPVFRERKIPNAALKNFASSLEASPTVRNCMKDDKVCENATAPLTAVSTKGVEINGDHGEVDGPAEEIYDDITDGSSGVVQDEIYDDVIQNNEVPNNQKDDGDELYDDVATTAQAGGNDDFYDDVLGAASESRQPHGLGEEGAEEQQGEAVYEPVESISQYVTQNSVVSVQEEKPSKQTLDKTNKKKEEKERKEKEKLEKKKKEEAEKQRRKDEEEKRRKEKEERKRIEKERKLFNLKVEDDPVPIERRMAECDIKGKGKDLTIVRGEYLDVISKHNCPKGKVLVQNSSGKLGYVQLKDIGMDRRTSLLVCASPVAPSVAFGGDVDDVYDDVCELPRPTSSSEIVPLASNNFKNGTTVPSFGQSCGVFQLGQSAKNSPSTTENEGGADEDAIYEVA